MNAIDSFSDSHLPNLTGLVDDEGYLLAIENWNSLVAQAIAKQEGLKLTSEHWRIIQWLRQYYLEYRLFPNVRTLVLTMRAELGKEKGNSLYLQSLFPKGLLRQASKVAGLPKPEKCL